MAVHKITLTYNLDPENLTSQAKAMDIQKGDTLEFINTRTGPASEKKSRVSPTLIFIALASEVTLCWATS